MLVREARHMPTASTELRPQLPKTSISQLTPAKVQQYRQRAMDRVLQDAAQSPSTSQNRLYNSLMKLQKRGFQTAPESEIRLSGDKPGLLGGSGRENNNLTKQLGKREETGSSHIWQSTQEKLYETGERGFYDRVQGAIGKDAEDMRAKGYSQEKIDNYVDKFVTSWPKDGKRN